MKHKVSTAVLLLFFAVAAGSSPAETTYSDAVGYQQLNLEPGRNFVGIPFEHHSSTLSGILGTNQLPQSNSVTKATVIDIWDQDNQNLTNRFFLSSESGFGGWRYPNFGDANSVTIDRTKGLVITIRSNEQSQVIAVAGTVPTGVVQQAVVSNGYTVAAAMFPVEVALGDSGLTPSGFTGGDSLVNSDNVIFYNPNTDIFDEQIWYYTGDSTWRNANASLATRKIQPGESFLIRRRNRTTAMTWSQSAPYTFP